MTLTFYNLFLDRCEPTNEIRRYRQCRFQGIYMVGIEVNETDVRFACDLLNFRFDTLMRYLLSVSDEVTRPVEPTIRLDDEFDLLNALWECSAATSRNMGDVNDKEQQIKTRRRVVQHMIANYEMYQYEDDTAEITKQPILNDI